MPEQHSQDRAVNGGVHNLEVLQHSEVKLPMLFEAGSELGGDVLQLGRPLAEK